MRLNNLKLQMPQFSDDEKISFVLNATVFLLVCNAFYVQWMGTIGVEEGLPYYKYIVFLMFLCTSFTVLKGSFRLLLSVILFAVPEFIAELKNERTSTWFQGYNENYFRDMGVLYRELFPTWWRPIVVFQILRHRNLYKEYGVWKAIKKALRPVL